MPTAFFLNDAEEKSILFILFLRFNIIVVLPLFFQFRSSDLRVLVSKQKALRVYLSFCGTSVLYTYLESQDY